MKVMFPLMNLIITKWLLVYVLENKHNFYVIHFLSFTVYHSPCLAILDEATSAVSLDVVELLYSECVQRQMTLISVAHRESVRKFHSHNLVLHGTAQSDHNSHAESWTISDIEYTRL